jgi:hypothetical protein
MARFGADQPDSILEVIPEAVRDAVLRLPDELFALPPEELEAQAQVSRQDRRIRIQFWEEYEVAHRSLGQLDLSKVVVGSGVPSWPYYSEKLNRTPALLAWLVQPPAEYRLQMKEAGELGMQRLMDILELPQRNANGSVNTAVCLLQLQALKMVDQRLHGSITQKILSVNVDGGQKPENGQLSMEEVDRKLKELQKELDGATPHVMHTPLGKQEPIEVKNET